jgi:ATP-dependent Lon protease
VLAAHRAGIKNIVLPKDNEKDLADIPKNVLDAMNLYLVGSMDEVLKHALAGPLTPIPPTPDAPVAVEIDDVPDATTH